ncbi:conserved hypothetical protein [Ricinus communis]|uniref:Uncharacterized protein n=1 Tax=Ricinus communis TaxID=3988 RepID=B9RFB7_RICCO|nr:conserved hypothetical protein [Ricinus communis]
MYLVGINKQKETVDQSVRKENKLRGIAAVGKRKCKRESGGKMSEKYVSRKRSLSLRPSVSLLLLVDCSMGIRLSGR